MAKYDWINDYKAQFEEAFGKGGEGLEIDPYMFIGVAVANLETGEAALIRFADMNEVDIGDADFAQDILGDAQNQYDEVLTNAFPARHRHLP